MQKRGNRLDYVGRMGCRDMQDHDSEKTYRRGVNAFCDWVAEKHGIKYEGQLKGRSYAALIKEFASDLVSGSCCKASGQVYTPATISTYVKGACHAFGVDFKSVNADPDGKPILPRRTAGAIVKGTGRGDTGANPQGRRELYSPKFARFVELARVTEVRRSELGDIRGRNLVTDESGHLCIAVERGKGGKYTLQRVLPWEQAAIWEIFAGLRPKDFVLSKAECTNKIDVHYIRAKRCQAAYDYYARIISAGGADDLRRELIARFDALHINGDTKKDAKARQEFLRQIYSDKAFVCRGENRRVAESNGRPTIYNRLALMCVSVYHLSHWRIDVTSVNYMSR